MESEEGYFLAELNVFTPSVGLSAGGCWRLVTAAYLAPQLLVAATRIRKVPEARLRFWLPARKPQTARPSPPPSAASPSRLRTSSGVSRSQSACAGQHPANRRVGRSLLPPPRCRPGRGSQWERGTAGAGRGASCPFGAVRQHQGQASAALQHCKTFLLSLVFKVGGM